MDGHRRSFSYQVFHLLVKINRRGELTANISLRLMENRNKHRAGFIVGEGVNTLSFSSSLVLDFDVFELAGIPTIRLAFFVAFHHFFFSRKMIFIHFSFIQC